MQHDFRWQILPKWEFAWKDKLDEEQTRIVLELLAEIYHRYLIQGSRMAQVRSRDANSVKYQHVRAEIEAAFAQNSRKGNKIGSSAQDLLVSGWNL